MKITITGGSGFLGSNVADKLSQKGHQVTIFDKKKSNWIRSDQKMYVGNIFNYKDLENAIKGADVVFHFAAIADIDQALSAPIKTVNINILGTVYALEICRKYKIKRFIYASTIYVNSTEGGFYRSSKKAAEDYVEEYNKNYGLNYTILRFGSLYGNRSEDWNGVKKVVKSAFMKRKVIYKGNINSVREYIHISDAAKACADILKNKYKNKHTIITGTKKIKVSNFLQKLSKILKIKSKIQYQNKKNTGHYTLIPSTFKPKKGRKFIFKSSTNFNDGLLQLVSEIKKD